MLANAKCFAKVRKMCAGIIQSSRTEFVDLIERESDFSTTETRSPLQMTLADNGAKLGQQSTGRSYFGATLGRILTRTINAGAGIRSNPLAVVLAASKRALSWSGKQYPTFMTWSLTGTVNSGGNRVTSIWDHCTSSPPHPRHSCWSYFPFAPKSSWPSLLQQGGWPHLKSYVPSSLLRSSPSPSSPSLPPPPPPSSQLRATCCCRGEWPHIREAAMVEAHADFPSPAAHPTKNHQNSPKSQKINQNALKYVIGEPNNQKQAESEICSALYFQNQ